MSLPIPLINLIHNYLVPPSRLPFEEELIETTRSILEDLNCCSYSSNSCTVEDEGISKFISPYSYTIQSVCGGRPIIDLRDLY